MNTGELGISGAIKAPRPRIMRQALAPVIATLALATPLTAAAGTAEASSNNDPQVLIEPDNLSGADRGVYKEDRDLLRETAVKVFYRKTPDLNKPLNGRWNNLCSGNLTRQYGEIVVSLSAHCITYPTNQREKGERNLLPKDYPYAGDNKAVDLAGYREPSKPINPFFSPIGSIGMGDNYIQYAVARDKDMPKPAILGVATSAVISLENRDQAILGIKPVHINGRPYIDFDSLPAIGSQGSNGIPKPGSRVRMYSFPGVAAGERVTAEGQFIKRIIFKNNNDRDLVGLVAKKGDKPPCHSGGSGHTYVAQGGKNGYPYFSGAYKGSITKIYPYTTKRAEIEAQPDRKSRNEFIQKKRQQADEAWKKYEKITGVNLSKFTILCFYSAPDKHMMQNLYKAQGHGPGIYRTKPLVLKNN